MWFPGHKFRGLTFVRRIVRLSLIVMQNLPPAKMPFEFSWAHLVVGRLFTGRGNVNDREHYATGLKSLFDGFEERSLQIETHCDEIPGIGLDAILAPFQVGDLRLDLQPTVGGALTQDFDRSRRSIHSGDLPAVFGKPDGVATRSASEIESLPGPKLRGRFSEQRVRRAFQIFFRSVSGAIALIPLVNFHPGIVDRARQKRNRWGQVSTPLSRYGRLWSSGKERACEPEFSLP